MKEKLYEEKGPYYMEDWCEEAGDSIENGSVKGDLYGGYSYALTINGEDAETFFQSPDVKELILRDISYPVKDGHASYSGLDEIVGYYSSLNFRDPDVQADLIKLGFDEEEVKSLAMYQDADSAKDEEIECWIDYDINLDDSNVENEENGVWEVDGFTYDTEEEARAGYKQAIDTEPSSDHILMYGNEEIEYYSGLDDNEEINESVSSSKYLTKPQLIAEINKGNLPEQYVAQPIGQGDGYKIDFDIWNNKFDENIVVYIPEFGYDEDGMPKEDSIYSFKDFLDICKGNREYALQLLEDVDWQYPETLYDEYGWGDDEVEEAVNITEAFSGEKGIETIVPFFSGFYNTMFEDYWNSKEEVGKIFTDVINKKIAEILPSFKYEFQHIQSPKYYNNGTDEIYANAIFNTSELFEFLNKNLDDFEKYCKNNFSSYDGFMSYLPNNAKEFMEKIKTVSGRDESSFVFGAIEFALEKSFGENIRYDLNEEAYYDCSDQLELDEYEYDDDEVEESVERQPDMFGAGDTVYKDGVEAQDFDNILDAVQKIAPKMGFVDGWDKGDYYVMKFEGENIDKKRFEDIKSQLIAKFGDGLKVQWGYHQYSPEQKSLFVAFIDRANFDDVELAEGIKDYLPRGGFMRDDEDDKSSRKTGAWFGQGTDDQIRKAKIIAKVKFAQGDRFGRVTKEDLDDFENYKEAYEEMFGPVELDEGWKDNLKRAAGVAAVAGGLMAGNAHAANIHDPYDDRAPHPEQSELYKDAVYVNQYEDKVIDKNGNEWTMNQWADMVAGENPYDDNDYPPEFTDDEGEINESYMITEGTGNFDMFEDSPNLALTNEEIENIDLEDDLFSSRNLPSWFEDYSRGNYPIHMVESTLDDDFAFIGARSGYYEGMNIGIVKNDEFEEWAYNNYDEANGMYYEYGSEDEITPEELKALFDKRVEEEYQKGIETLKYIKEKWGGRFINVAWRASNGETGYAEDKTLNEAEDPAENTEAPAQKPEGDTKGHPVSDFPINDTDVKIDDIKVRDSAWEELDLSGVMKAIDAEDAKATLGGDTAENTNISLRTSTAKSTTAEMKPSENKKQEKSKEPEIDKKDQKDRIDGAEKTKAEIHEGFEFKFNEKVLKEAEDNGDVITFEITNGGGFPCVVEVTNKSSGHFSADELKKVIERENPSIWFNDAEAKYWFMDFSFEKGGKTYWMSSDNIEGDMSKYELSIYDGNDYGNDDDDKKLNEAQITGKNSPSGIEFLKTLDDKGRYMFLSRMQSDCKYFLDGHEYNKFLWAGNVEDQIKYMKWLYNSFPKNKKPEWISMEEIEDYEKRMAGKGKEDHSRDEIYEAYSSNGYIMADASDDVFNGKRDEWEDLIKDVTHKVFNGDNTIEVRGYKEMVLPIEKSLKDMGFRILKREYEATDKKGMLDEGKVRLDTLHKLMDKCWYNSKDGKGARLGNWEMALGGYDRGYEFYYNNMPLFAINRWNEIDFYQDSENTKKYCGYTNKEIFDSLKSYRDLNDLKTSEELDESINTEIETGSTVLLKDGRKVEIIGRAYGSGGIQCGYKVFDEDTNTDGDPEEIMFDDIKRVIQEPILDEKKQMKEGVGGLIIDDKGNRHYLVDEIYLLKALKRNTNIQDSYVEYCLKANVEDFDEDFYNDLENDYDFEKSLISKLDEYCNNDKFVASHKDPNADKIGFEYYYLDKIEEDWKNYCKNRGLKGDGTDKLDESSRLKELASKMVLREADESSVAKVKINSIEFKGKEGRQDDKNWQEGKTYSFEEFQKLVYEYDYAFWNQADRGGYDKLWYTADITVDYNGKQEHIGYDGRLDLGDGKYGSQNVSVAYMVKNSVAKDLGIDESQVEIMNPEIPYDSESYAGKYGKYEDNLDKFIADRTAQIKTPKYAKDRDNTKADEIEVGDFFTDSDRGGFYRVTRRTKSSVWLEKVKSKTISTPYKNRGELDYQNNAYPTDEVDNSDSWSWFDTSKPFRLSNYGSYVLASQGRHYLSFWGGKELAESFEPKGEMLEAGNEQPFENPFKEGDILYSSWGYTMRLVDFYKVISSSKSFVKLAHLADYNASQDEYGQAGKKMPKLDQTEPDSNVDGRRFKVHIRDDGEAFVKINNYEWAKKWDGKPKSFDTYD